MRFFDVVRISHFPGGYIKDITFQSLTITNVSEGIDVSMFYSDARPPTNKTATPVFSNIRFINVTGINVGSPGEFTGLPESNIEDVFLSQVRFKGIIVLKGLFVWSQPHPLRLLT